MSKYYVGIREVWVRTVEVQADNPNDALEKARNNWADTMDNQELEYSHDLKPDTWQVEDEEGYILLPD